MLPFRVLLRAFLVLLTLGGSLGVRAQDDFLEPAQAFKLAVQQSVDGGELLIQFEIAADHYMYGEAFKLSTTQGHALRLVKPDGVRKFDETFQKEMETYRGRLQMRSSLPPGVADLLLTGQGCADRGLCYPPIQVQLRREPHGWSFSHVVAPDLTFGRTGFVPSGTRLPLASMPLHLDRLLAIFLGLLALLGLWAVASTAKS